MYILLGILLGIGFSMMDVSLYNAEKKQENWNKPVYYIVTIICYVVAVIISFIAKLVNGTDVVLTISILPPKLSVEYLFISLAVFSIFIYNPQILLSNTSNNENAIIASASNIKTIIVPNKAAKMLNILSFILSPRP